MPSREATGAPAQYELVPRRVRGQRFVKVLDSGSKYQMKKAREEAEERYGGYDLCIEKVWNQQRAAGM